MSRSFPTEMSLGRPLDLAVVLALVSGLGALVDPDLTGLAVAVSGFALAAYLLERRRADEGALRWDRAAFASLGAAAAGVVLFAVAIPPPWSALRGLALAAGLVPMWWTSRHRAVSSSPPEAAS